MKKTFSLLAVAALFAAPAGAATLTWNFGAANVSATGAYTGGTPPTGVTVGSFSIGNTLGTVATPITNTSPSIGYTGASGGDNLGNAFRNGTLNTSTGGSGYFTLTITTTNLPNQDYLVLSDFDFGVRSTGTGAKSYTLRSSADNFATDIFTGVIVNDSTYTLKDNTFADFKVRASSGVEFRLYGYNGVGSPASNTVNTRIDDVKITITAVPEPATYGIILGGAVGLFAFARARSKRAALR